MSHSPPIRAAFLLAVLMMAGCYRPDTRERVLDIPEARSAEELRVLRAMLLEDQDRLRDSVLYESIRVRETPPALVVVYNSRHLADRNVETRVNELGFRVNDLPGDERKLRAFRNALSRSSTP